MTSYFSPLRKSIRWYQKVAFQLLLGISVINALILYKKITGKSTQISEFCQELIIALAKVNKPLISPISKKHTLIESNEYILNSNRKKRRRCIGCYENLQKQFGRNEDQKSCKQVNTMCETCENKPYYCITCFQKKHG